MHLLPISIVMLTHNSARILNQVLSSLDGFAEIVIVDSGSTDQTLEIAAKFNAKVFQRPMNDGFGIQKNYAVTCASHDWVFVVDSDEVVSEELFNEISALVQKGDVGTAFSGEISGYEVRRPLFFLSHRLKYSGTQTDWQMRLFDRKRGNFNSARVHENVVFSSGKMGILRGDLEHYSYPTIDDYFTKFKRYTSLAAQELVERERAGERGPVNVMKLITAFPATFIKLYFLKLGILDGLHGFLWCFFSAVYPVVKYTKYYQLKSMS